MTMIAVRRVAGAATLAILLYLVQLALLAPGARADHIPDTGPVPDNCVEFQVSTTGPKTPPDYPNVTIDVTGWDADLKGFDFTISGLAAGEYVDISVKSGQEIDEPGGFGNGSHHWSHTRQFAISHVRACVFEDTSEETTTSVGEETTTSDKGEETTTTSTTVQETTTTTGATSTSALQFTTSTLGSTTTTADEPVTTVSEQTTTSEDDQAGTSETTDADGAATGTLPFTGPTGGAMVGLGALALFTGAMLLFVASARLEHAPAVVRPRWSRF